MLSSSDASADTCAIAFDNFKVNAGIVVYI